MRVEGPFVVYPCDCTYVPSLQVCRLSTCSSVGWAWRPQIQGQAANCVMSTDPGSAAHAIHQAQQHRARLSAGQ